MLVEDIYEELKEATGICEETTIFRRLTHAIQLLANEGLFDPQIGYIDFTIDSGYYIALPRDVKTPLKINISNKPTFHRSRLYEFVPNTRGTQDGDEEVQWEWHNRGYAPIQDERHLPSKLRYKATVNADAGLTAEIIGITTEGEERKETLTAAVSLAECVPSTYTYQEVRSLTRLESQREMFLVTDDNFTASRYEPTDTCPEYRVIKLSATGIECRMMYRKHVFKIESQRDIIPVHSAMAVIYAVKVVQLLMEEKYTEAAALMGMAVEIIKKEQASREEGETLADKTEIQSAINRNIRTNDLLIVADVYDDASAIFGPVGQAKLIDRISDAVQALSAKAHWESTLGVIEVVKACNIDTPQGPTGKGHGIFALPGIVGVPLAVNLSASPARPRNGWHEFHFNGSGEKWSTEAGWWEDYGTYPTINFLPRDESLRTKKVIPQKLVAVCTDARDEDVAINVSGAIQNDDGTMQRIIVDDHDYFTLPCKATQPTPGDSDPLFGEITRITKPATKGYIKIIAPDADNLLLAWLEPKDREAAFRLVKTPFRGKTRIRIKFRRRDTILDSLDSIIFLRSRSALRLMMQAIKAEVTDPVAAEAFAMAAVKRLEDDQSTNYPHLATPPQFDTPVCPALTTAEEFH